MADPVTRPSKPKGEMGGGKKIAGIPVTYLVIGAVVVVGGYLWIKHQQAASGSTAGSTQPPKAAAGSPQAPGGGNQRFIEIIKEWHGHGGGRAHPVDRGGPKR